MRAPFAPPRLSVPRNDAADDHAVATSWEMDNPDLKSALQSSNVPLADQFMIDCGNRVLPYLGLLGNERAEVSRARSHVAMRQLVPRLGERIGELIGMLVEAPRDSFVSRIEPQSEVSGQHGWRATLRLVIRIRHRTGGCAVFGLPLIRTCRALGQFPFVAEQVLEEVVAPLGWRRAPGHFQAAGDRVSRFARAIFALPAKALVLDPAGFRLRAHQRRVASAVRFAEAVTAGNQRDRFFVVHRHAAERLTDIPRCSDWVRVSIGPFGIDVNQAHLNSAQGKREVTVAAVALIRQPRALTAPVKFIGLPDVGASAGKAVGLEAHRLQRDVTGENHEIGPGNFPAVLLLYRPEQSASLVQVRVIGPAVQRRETLRRLRLLRGRRGCGRFLRCATPCE